MIDPVQGPTAAVSSASATDASTFSTDVGVVASAQKAAAPATSNASAETAQAAQAAKTSTPNSTSDSQSASDGAQPLRLLIERDKATNHYVYKLYDSSGRIVREIPQESLADAQKQAAGSPGSLIDTRV
jgi:uncharacterized FlaG/YvyC family protein